MSEESGRQWGGGAQHGGAAAGEEEAKKGSLQPSSAKGDARPGSDVKPFRNQENEGDLISSLFFTLALQLYEFKIAFCWKKLRAATWTLLNSLSPFGST
jgi:hypothetical protein